MNIPRPAAAARTVTVLGSTGSIGCSTIDLLTADPDRYRVEALVGGRNVVRLAEQALALRPRVAVLADEAGRAELAQRLAGSGVEVAAGPDAVLEAAARPADWTMSAITGAVGLGPTLAAIRNGRAVALANKEALVCAGDVMLDAVRQAGATLLPVDSEHNAIFQALGGRYALHEVERIVLTASGGPFRTASLDAMRTATPETALRHPTWSMGAKISIDSATMFNKGLELIEAARLFGLDEGVIDVLVHPQSVVHGMVQFRDGSILAQLGAADMRIPIAHCLAWPDRTPTTAPRLDLAAIATLQFECPEPIRFPSLRLSRAALREGGAAPAILNAANEVAVEAFLARRIGFLDIAVVVEATIDHMGSRPAATLEAVLDADAQARSLARARVAGTGCRPARRAAG